MNKFKALIVDDEMENLTLLKILLTKLCKDDVKVVAQASNVEDAIEAYLKHKPDILFLDISLGESKTSFEIIESIENLESEIIFITSFDEFALKAIKHNVSSYLLKPLRQNELVNAVEKAVENCRDKDIIKSKFRRSSKRSSELIAIPTVNNIELIRIEDVVYLEADGRYTIFYTTDGSTRIASRNLGEYEKIFNPNDFFRIHNRYLVNLNMVININKAAGNYCELLNNKALPIAKRRYEELNEFLNLKN